MRADLSNFHSYKEEALCVETQCCFLNRLMSGSYVRGRSGTLRRIMDMLVKMVEYIDPQTYQLMLLESR